MDRAKRSDLLKRVQTHEEELTRYKTRLTDVVKAYKNLLKEKEALEASVKALTSAAPAQPAAKPSDPLGVLGNSKHQDDQSQDAEGDKTEDKFVLEGQATGTEVDTTEIQRLKEQLATLTNSLSTVAQQKSSMEASYQAEKKKLRQDHEEKVKKLTDENEKQADRIYEIEMELAEWKKKLLIQQQEREKEEADHAVMLRELQKLLADERVGKENLEHQLYDARQLLIEKQNVPDVSAGYERQLQILRKELEEVRRRLKDSENKSEQPSPLLLQLQKEMAEVKAQHRIQLQQEQRRANDAEQQIRNVSNQSEERVSCLETKLSELSGVVGQYERLRYQDQQAIQKLRERVTQLDLENTALARAAHGGVSNDNDSTTSSDDSNLDVQALVDKITRLKGMVKLANERSEKPVNIDELLGAGSIESLDAENLHKKCQAEYDQLKEEFERYKLRAQSVLKNKSSKETSKETEGLKTQVADLREKVRSLRDEIEEQELNHKEKEENLRKTITALEERFKEELANMASDYKQKEADLELEIRKHRERTIALLSEKDKEIEILRAKSPERYESHYISSFRRTNSQASDSEGSEYSFTVSGTARKKGSSGDTEAVVSELLAKNTLGGPHSSDTSILYFAHEQARKDVEINSLRKQKHSLELALRDLQHTSSMKEEKYQEQVELLKEDVRKYERNKSRESANLEYLKNVVYQYMVCSDSHGKQQMLNAISTILQFSPKEKDAVTHRILKGWWVYTK